MVIDRLFIAEKPSVAETIAACLGGQVKKNGYYVCGNDVVTWCVGHILELADPEDYNINYKKWVMSDLPLKLRPHKLKPKDKTKSQFDVISQLLKECKTIVHAGDPDEEGQLLVDEVIYYCKAKQPVQRILINDNNTGAVSKALLKIRSNNDFIGLYNKGLARSIADQLYGFNMTRAYTLAAQARGSSGQTYNVGRVQTPILGLIVARYLENKNHNSSFYYNINGHFDFAGSKIGGKFVPTDEDPIDEKKRVISENFAQQVVSACKGSPSKIISHSIQDKKSLAPLPFALLNLQTLMNTKYGYTAQKTLEITQVLRDKFKAITYNRSDCNYLSSEQFGDAKETLSMLSSLYPVFKDLRIDDKKKGRAFNDSKVTAHTAIIPTTVRPDIDSMKVEERNVYKAIVDQYIIQFMPDRTYKECKVSIQVNDKVFSTSARNITDKGFSSFIPVSDDDDSDIEDSQKEESSFGVLSSLKNGLMGTCEDVKYTKEKTKPRKLYTEATLLNDLKSVAKYVKDPKISKLLKDRDAGKGEGESGGIGTAATRGSMIEKLKTNNFITVQDKYLVPTLLGVDFIGALPEISTAPDMTALWHEQQIEIEKGNITVDKFLDDLEDFISNQIKNIDLSGMKIKVSSAPLSPQKMDFALNLSRRIDIPLNKAQLADPVFINGFILKYAGTKDNPKNPPTEKMTKALLAMMKSRGLTKKDLHEDAFFDFNVSLLEIKRLKEIDLPKTPASAKQINFIEHIERSMGKTPPDGYKEDSRLCAKFIESVGVIPPSEKQIKLAEHIFNETKKPLPEGYLKNYLVCTGYIKENPISTEREPTEKQIAAAKKLSEELSMSLPSGYEKSMRVCSEFITKAIEKKKKSGNGGGSKSGAKNYSSSGSSGSKAGSSVKRDVMPPTEKQIAKAKFISDKKGIPLPKEAISDRFACSEFIKNNMSQEEMDNMAPTPEQVSYAEKLAARKGISTPAEVYKTAKLCSEFIERNRLQVNK